MAWLNYLAAFVIMFLVVYLLLTVYGLCMLIYKIWADSCKRK